MLPENAIAKGYGRRKNVKRGNLLGDIRADTLVRKPCSPGPILRTGAPVRGSLDIS